MSRVAVELPTGPTSVSVADETPTSPWTTLVIAHGAGAGMDHPFLVGFAAGMREEGVRTVRFTFPYLEAGRRMPGPATHAIATWRAVVTAVSAATPVWLCGKSYGGRMASMAVADGLAAAGLVYLGYPLHAPGKPDKPRAEHLSAITVPQLFLSGTRDPFVDPHAQLEEVVAACQDATLRWVDGGGHSFEIAGRKRPADVIGAELAPVVADFLRR
nr:alpha/beta family hydrolase [Microbacterium gorillae]